MKTSAIIRIVLYSLAIILLVSILAAGLLVNTFMVNTDWETVFDIELPSSGGTVSSFGSVDSNSIRDISVEWAAGSITIRRGDVDTITFEETGASSEKDIMVWTQTGSKLLIQYAKNQAIFGITINTTTPSKDLVITVPQNWECDELEIDAASAGVDIDSLTIGAFQFDGASGFCTLKNCHIDVLDLDTASGNIYFTGTLNELDCDSASANCTITVTNEPKRIEIDSVSGDLDLTLPADCGFTASLDCLSGNFSSDFPTENQNGFYKYGSSGCQIDISALSGDITIRKGE